MSKPFVCEVCGNSYLRNQALKKHLLTVHPSAYVPKHYNFNCEICKKKFNQQRNLNFHLRKIHNVNVMKNRIKCAICHLDFLNNVSLIEHLKDEHQIKVETENKQFSNFSEFLQWKKELEEQTKSSFVHKKYGPEISGNVTRHYYTCSRSGYYKSSGKGKRHLKVYGSKKINAYCPCKIIVNESSDGSCIVVFVKGHVGHDTDLGNLHPSQNEKENLASELQKETPFETILDIAFAVPEPLNNDNINDLSLLIPNQSITKNRDYILCQLSSQSVEPTVSLETDLEKKELIQNYIDFLNSLETTDDLQMAKTTLKEMKDKVQKKMAASTPPLLSVKLGNIGVSNLEPHNKKVISQKRPYLIKKKKQKSTLLCLPSQEEHQPIPFSLCNVKSSESEITEL